MSERNGLEIAVIGMAGRFAKAQNLKELWRNLRDGVEGISFFTDEEMANIVPAAMLANPNYVKACGVLEDADHFDAGFFDYSPRDAQILDPQQRVLLECAWEALESAGYAGTSRPVGVYVGVTQNSYLLQLVSDPELVSAVGLFALVLANEKDHTAPRLAYKLNLEGPSVTVQTACSTSLVAVHLACQSLLAGECEMALAGGASVRTPMKQGHFYQAGGIVSDDGHTRTFDAAARGTATGQGVGLVLLKLLEDALADGDPIHAVIKGSAINNDGSEKPGFTAPRRDGQMKVIRAAQLRAEVPAESIGYIEAHGTATPLGDPIEVSALTHAFRMSTQRRTFCALGSIKSNLGHADAAAGVAGLIKTVLAIEHGEIPPSLHFESPNPEIDFAASPFYVNDRISPWPALGGPRRAGVSSFGVGGANAHVILEEPPQREPSGPSRPVQLLTLSARTATALDRMTDDLAAHLRDSPGESLADVAYTLRVGRRDFRHRRALVATNPEEAAAALAERDPRRLMTGVQEAGSRPLAFLLPGVGDQYPGMAAGLYRTEPTFREEIDRCAELLAPRLGLDLRDVLFAAGAAPAATGGAGLDLRALLQRGDTAKTAEGPLFQTRVAQPAMFAVGYALARTWMSWGVRPQALLGYSLGEYTAACLAGVLTLEDALALVADRARLINDLPAGAMLALPLTEEETVRLLPSELALAAVNAPSVSIVAGPVAAVAAFEQRLASEGLLCRRVATSHAFHSKMMEPIAGAFLERVRQVALHRPQIAYLSNVTGTWVRDEEVTNPNYWVAHLRGTVRFADAVGELWREPGRALLEIGPGQTLGSLALQHPASAQASAAVAIPSLRHQHEHHDDQAFLLRGLGQLWMAGVEIPPAALYQSERRHRVQLPTYPFERQRHWFEGKTAAGPATASAAAGPRTAEGKIADPADWFHMPSWKLSMRPAPARKAAERWLLLADACGVADRLRGELAATGCEVTTAVVGPGFARLGERHFALAPDDPEAYDRLLAELGVVPERIVHAWSLNGGSPATSVEEVERAQETGFYSLISLAQALGRRGFEDKVEISVVTDGLCAVERVDPLLPEKATLIGPVRVISQEYPHFTCRAIDIDAREAAGIGAGALLAELASTATEPIVALRGHQRWLPSAEPVRLPAAAERPAPLREGGVYLITGGLGGLGLALAGHLAHKVRARLALVGRTPLPERSIWAQILAAGDDNPTARKIRAVQALEAAGAEVLLLAGDVADVEWVRTAVAAVQERFGSVHGVFHTAGVPGAGLLQLKSRETAAAVLAPKVRGTLALTAALRGVPVDFVVLYSAVASLTGGIGQVDYCAANAFLDAFARQRRERAGEPIVAVNWCEWQWDDWSERLTAMDSRIQGELARVRRIYGLTFEEGIEALERSLASGEAQIIVSTHSLRSVIEQQHSISQILDALDHAAAPVAGRHARPSLPTAYVAPGNELEERLSELWRALLGIDQIGIHDNFFQLGGHSLLGLQVMSRLHEAFHVELPLRALFEAPTVSELAALVTAAREEGATAPSIPEIRRMEPVHAEQVLQNLDSLSEEEMDALLAEMAEEEELYGEGGLGR
jgi:acyl transferase domain-containing protein/acyl carrier protein